ncbi:MAG: Gfo/Idh/MocA family oxidoreductase [Oscillospiraceae bacterium]|nr:Gfo/Idh/MocA family oxidoreductase [Oscillospiraceae bacterium]
MGIKLGIVGVGAFAQCFIPLFKAHPLVGEVTLCDLDAVKLEENSARHGIPKKSPSLDDLLETDIDAVAIITQNWMHAPQAIKAARAGKHVYSAVPAGISLPEIRELVSAVEQTGRIYMMGETSYYYPAVILCREKYKNGEFGDIVYGEGEYYHDWDHGLYDVMKARGGERWMETAGGPPMHYPTHSTSQIISVTGAHMTHVSCHGFTDKKDDGIYRADANLWKNVFSNESALFAMSDQSCCRINEFRRIGHTGAVRMSLFGTEGSFEQNSAGLSWLTKNGRENVDDLLEQVIPAERLPKELREFSGGHNGAEKFLVDDFVKACIYEKTPPINVWEAARYTVPGIIAHESALQGGALLEIPDFGGPKF